LKQVVSCQETQHQQPLAPQTCEKSLQTPVQLHLSQQEIQRTGLSVQAPSSTNNETLKVVTVVQHVMTDLSEALSEKGKIMLIIKMVLNLM
jgi:hypothetical protein